MPQEKWIDYYVLLDLYGPTSPANKGPDSSLEEIKGACRIQRMAWHPDRFQRGTKQYTYAEERTKLINEACEVLSKPVKKKIYDQEWLDRNRGFRRQEETYGTAEIALSWNPTNVFATTFYQIPHKEKRTATLEIKRRAGRGFTVEITEPLSGWLRIVEPPTKRGIPDFVAIVEVDTTSLQPGREYSDTLSFRVSGRDLPNREVVRVSVAPTPIEPKFKPEPKVTPVQPPVSARPATIPPIVIVICPIIFGCFLFFYENVINYLGQDVYTVGVDAQTTSWQDTGIKVKKGDQITFSVVGALWSEVRSNYVGSEGDGRFDCAILPSANYGALIGRVGDSNPQLVGASSYARRITISTAPTSGNIKLAINICPERLKDFRGSYTQVWIGVVRRRW